MQKITYRNQFGKEVTLSSNPQSAYFLKRIIDSLGKTEQAYSAIGEHGQKKINPKYNPRIITCECIYACETDILTYKKGWQNILNIFAPHLHGTLTYENEVGKYAIDVKPLETPILSRQQFSIQFEADFPLWRSVESTEFVFGSVKPLWKFPFAFANGPLKMGEWQKVFHYVNESGIDTPFKVIIKGVGDFCKITNDDGNFIMINKPIMQGQSLKVDTSTGKVKLVDVDGTESFANQYVELGSNLKMKLHNGENTLIYDNGISTLPVATISINQYYIGVVI